MRLAASIREVARLSQADSHATGAPCNELLKNSELYLNGMVIKQISHERRSHGFGHYQQLVACHTAFEHSKGRYNGRNLVHAVFSPKLIVLQSQVKHTLRLPSGPTGCSDACLAALACQARSSRERTL